MSQPFSTESFESMVKQDPYVDSGQTVVNFYLRPVMNRAKSREANRAIYEEKEYLRIFSPGNVKYSVVDREVWPIDKQRFKRQYADWKAGRASVRVGTPLAGLPWISMAQVEELKFFEILTVEELANVSDTVLQRFMGATALRDEARKFLGASDATKKALEEKDDQIAALKKAMDEMNARLAQVEQAKQQRR